MRRIAICNQKGGVGKTTTTVNLAAAIAELGHRVCVVDLDPQGHTTLHLGADAGGGAPTILDALRSRLSLVDIRRRVSERLTVVPAAIDLAAVESALPRGAGRELVLRRQVNALEAEGDAFVLFDCPPALGVLTLSALAAADELVIPLQPHFLALHGLSSLLETVDAVTRAMQPSLIVTGVILSMYESNTRLSAEIIADLESYLASQRGLRVAWRDCRIFATRVRRNVRLAECPSFGQHIFQYAPESHGAEDYRALAVELVAADCAVRSTVA